MSVPVGPMALLDVHDQDPEAVVGCVVASNWLAELPVHEFRVGLDGVAPYVPGQFFRRELPCLLAALQRLDEPPGAVVVDGYVWLGDGTNPGLGAHLFAALGESIPVVGVAKTRFASCRVAAEVMRGHSQRPLFVTAAGMRLQDGAQCVKSMHGPDRVPTLLRRVDRLCRASAQFGGSEDVGLTRPPAPY